MKLTTVKEIYRERGAVPGPGDDCRRLGTKRS